MPRKKQPKIKPMRKGKKRAVYARRRRTAATGMRGKPLTITPHNLSDLLQWEDLKDDPSYRSLQDQLSGIGITMNTILDAVKTPAPIIDRFLEEKTFNKFLQRFYLIEARVEAMYGRMVAEALTKEKIER